MRHRLERQDVHLLGHDNFWLRYDLQLDTATIFPSGATRFA